MKQLPRNERRKARRKIAKMVKAMCKRKDDVLQLRARCQRGNRTTYHPLYPWSGSCLRASNRSRYYP